MTMEDQLARADFGVEPTVPWIPHRTLKDSTDRTSKYSRRAHHAFSAAFKRNVFMKVIYLSLGLSLPGLGILGIPLPIFTTTPFLLLAIACFARSSKRFEKWLYQTAVSKLCSRIFENQINWLKNEEQKDYHPNICFNGNFNLFAPIFG